MSIHMHMRAVAEPEIRDDHTWLAAFMRTAWENHPAADAAKSWELPIYGGRPVAHSADADPSDPPLGILDPPGVSQAADFLASVSFDELWNLAGAQLVWSGWDEAPVRQEFLDHHRHLRDFYGRAATTGHAVVRAVWA
ncbi:DUF1877 family protein [Streptomyces lydicus]